MSKINIQGTIDNIRSKSNVYTPIIEAVVNSIDSIQKSNIKNGEVKIIIKRDVPGLFNDAAQLPLVRHVEIHNNGSGFNKVNRNSFDTFYSDTKRDIGGKGFGRFLFLKYFNEVKVRSNYKELDNKHYIRTFTFGRKDEIIIGEADIVSESEKNHTIVFLNHLQEDKPLDKELTTIARKLLEKLLIFFVSETAPCPKIIVEDSTSKETIILNEYLNQNKEITSLSTKTFDIRKDSKTVYSFTAKIFKVYYSKTDSKVILTGHNREVTQSTLHTYVPEFEDEFYDTFGQGDKSTKKNYSIKVYILGTYLDDNVSLERETFNFDRDKATLMYDLSQTEIEREAANLAKTLFSKEVKVRSEKKVSRIREYVATSAPWHKTYMDKVDYSEFSYTMTDEKIELELQKYKFHSEQNNRADLTRLLKDETETEFDQKLSQLASKITDIAKADLAHYVCSRKLILETLDALRQRNDDGKAKLEDEVHSLIYPMNKDSETVPYENHNLWILDERLVFSEYVASDRKISKKKGASDEPDLVVFHNSLKMFEERHSFRMGDNEFSNPLTIFEFKRPKRTNYQADDDPVLQIGRYLDKIRQGKYEMPRGTEPIKVNVNTPVYAYVICDLVDKVREFARNHSLTISPDNEGYFGFHPGFNMYIEIVSYKKLMKDASMRNRIFFKKLNLE
ncbi:MAG: ATP-binding protein [Chitinophagaceae bacterium]